MAAALAARFPDVEVAVARFAQWSPPPGGVPLLACALAWHWLDPATRNRQAHDALTRWHPGRLRPPLRLRRPGAFGGGPGGVRVGRPGLAPRPAGGLVPRGHHRERTLHRRPVGGLPLPVPLTTAGYQTARRHLLTATAPPTGAAGYRCPRGDRRRRRRLRRHRHPRPADHAGAGPPASRKNRWAGRVDPRPGPVRPGDERVDRRPRKRGAEMAKYMLIMRGTDESVATMMETPFEEMLETVGRFNEELIRAGVLSPPRAWTTRRRAWWSTSAGRRRWSPTARTARRRSCSAAST